MTNTKILEAKENGLTVEGGFIETDTVIWAAGIRSAKIVDGIDGKTQQAGRIAVDEITAGQGINVAVGDLAGLKDENNNLYPQWLNSPSPANARPKHTERDPGKETEKISIRCMASW